jgi:ketosteroid isomerase-like protein
MSRDRQAIVDLETRFWQSMVEKDAKLARTMIADECIVAGPSGAMKIDPAKYEAMTRDGNWDLDRFELDDVEVIFPSDAVAVIAYKVHQTGTLKGRKMDMTCADSSTWVKDGKGWKCAAHTETILQNQR